VGHDVDIVALMKGPKSFGVALPLEYVHQLSFKVVNKRNLRARMVFNDLRAEDEDRPKACGVEITIGTSKKALQSCAESIAYAIVTAKWQLVSKEFWEKARPGERDRLSKAMENGTWLPQVPRDGWVEADISELRLLLPKEIPIPKIADKRSKR